MVAAEIKPLNKDQLADVAAVYAEVFAGTPWFEVSKCTVCGDFSKHDPVKSVGCSKDNGTFSLQAYPQSETEEYIGSELKHAKAIGLIAIAGVTDQKVAVVGFAWGYELTRQGLAEAKWKTDNMKATVSKNVPEVFFYVSEVGVIEKYQGKGIGTKLARDLIGNERNIVLRTNENSPMRTIAGKLNLKPVIGLNTGVEDMENRERVLFVS